MCSCFALLCYFLLYSKVNQLSVSIYSLFFAFASHLGHHIEHWVEFLVVYGMFSLVIYFIRSDQIRSFAHSLSCVRLFATPWIATRHASLSITNSWSSLRLTSIESVMPSSHLILCRTLLLLPPILPSISLFQWVNSSHEVAKVLEFQL